MPWLYGVWFEEVLHAAKIFMFPQFPLELLRVWREKKGGHFAGGEISAVVKARGG